MDGYGLKKKGKDYPEKTYVFEEDGLTEEERWNMWYEAELKVLAELMFDMDEKHFYNDDYTPIKN